MKRIVLAVAIITLFSLSASAQKGTKQISGGLEVGIPTGDFGRVYKAGLGVNGKALFGITDNGAITATTGYSSWSAEGSSSDYKVKIGVIPVLAGYRHTFKPIGIYAEPQLGFGIYTTKVKYGGEKTNDSGGNFTWALGGGYVYENFDFSLRYQSGEASGGSLGIFALKIAYNFTLGGK